MLAIATLSPESTAISTIINQEVFFLAIYLFSGLELIDMLRCRKKWEREREKGKHQRFRTQKFVTRNVASDYVRHFNETKKMKLYFPVQSTLNTLSWKMYSHKLHLNNSPSLSHIHWQFQFNSVGNEDVAKAPLAIHPPQLESSTLALIQLHTRFHKIYSCSFVILTEMPYGSHSLVVLYL